MSAGSGSTGPKRSRFMREQHLAQTASYYLHGLSQAEIGVKLGVSQAQISKDLAAIRKRWRAESIRDFDERTAEELARIDEIEREYWDAWERSKKQKSSTRATRKSTPAGVVTEASKTADEMIGDPRYLAGVQWCIERRCAILGLDAPEESHVTTTNRGVVVKVSAEEIAALPLNNLAEFWKSVCDNG